MIDASRADRPARFALRPTARSGCGKATTQTAYLNDLTWNVHCDDAYAPLREQFGERLKKLQFRYQDAGGKRRGGIVVSDRRTGQSSSPMFGDGKPVATVIPGGQQSGPGGVPQVR
ncbi:hypothetical protein AB0C40_12480 [Streptomyces brevispora]|uniref:hypothetical protein n=1 Tax=Streptomyces brevispora TaxID=887462 RepID=UPI0033E3F11D